MLTLIDRKNIKIALLTLCLSLMVLAEPVLAKKSRSGNRKRAGGNPKSRQVAKGVPGNKIHQPPNATKARTKAAPLAQSIGPKPILRTAKSRDRGILRRTVKSNFRQSRRVKSSRPTSRMSGTAFDDSKHSGDAFDGEKRTRTAFASGKHVKGAFDAKKHARGSFDAGKLARGSFNAGKHARGSFDAGKLTWRGGHRLQRRKRDKFSFNLSFGSSHLTRRHHRHRGFRRHQPPIFNRIVWPTYRRTVYYNRGPNFTFRYVYPYHHRKYLFVSLGGYWPLEYRYVRYYRYGCHPYKWYGYYPAVYELEGDTYNYYTYNYNDNDNVGLEPSGIRPVDENTFADVRERLAAQSAKEPAPETLADRYFEDAVKAFEAGDYDTAADRFADAIELEPDDMVLPFAYVQALFADQQYLKAVEVLREAITKLPPDKEGVFYPRGLYPDDDILFEQIGRLTAKADLYPLDEDLQLLSGYQLLGAGKLDRAIGPLQQIGPNSKNSASAAKLLELLEKIKTENAEDKNS